MSEYLVIFTAEQHHEYLSHHTYTYMYISENWTLKSQRTMQQYLELTLN